jgi:hypothetical protein
VQLVGISSLRRFKRENITKLEDVNVQNQEEKPKKATRKKVVKDK